MSIDYSKNILAQENAADLLQDELGWNTAYASDAEVLGEAGTFGRGSTDETLLKRYFRYALRRLNPWITAAQLDQAQKALENCSQGASLLEVNQEKTRLLREGIPVDGEGGTRLAQVLDFRRPENNLFLAVKELKVGDRRADLVGFVNGIPMVFVALKRPDQSLESVWSEVFAPCQTSLPQMFFCNALVVLSNGEKARAGMVGSGFEAFRSWEKEEELTGLLRLACEKKTLLDFLKNQISFDRTQGTLVKLWR